VRLIGVAELGVRPFNKMRLRFAIFLVVILSPILLWVGSEVYHAKTSSPKGRATTYKEYREHLPTPIRAKFFIKKNQIFYETDGPIHAPLTFPSGPPAYIFDSQGRLIDWTSDSGDDPSFQDRWSKVVLTEISLADLDSKLRQAEQGAAANP